MMLDPSAKEEFDDVKSDIKTADMILPGLDEALAFDELLKHMENPTWTWWCSTPPQPATPSASFPYRN